MEVKILPIGTKTASVSDHVAGVVKILEKNGVKHELTPVGTVIEADTVDELLDLAKKMHEFTLNNVDRVVTFIELDDRKDKKLTMEGKIKSVKEKL